MEQDIVYEDDNILSRNLWIFTLNIIFLKKLDAKTIQGKHNGKTKSDHDAATT